MTTVTHNVISVVLKVDAIDIIDTAIKILNTSGKDITGTFPDKLKEMNVR